MMNDFEQTLELPSMGLLSGSKESLQIRSMTVKDEKILFRGGKGLGDKLLKFVLNCTDVTDKKEALSLPVSDVMLAFLKVRNLSVASSHHSFKIQCSVCEKTFQQQVDIDKQDIKYLEDETEPYEVQLPRAGKTVRVKYMRLSDQIALDKLANRREAMGAQDTVMAAERLATITEGVVGEEKVSFPSLCQFYENLHLSDMNFLIDSISDHDFGIDLTVYPKCPHCGSVDDHLIRIDSSFFRPPRGVLSVD